MNGGEIYKAVQAAYARLCTYQDMGGSVSVFTQASGSVARTHHSPFSTWFVRPEMFRFDYSEQVGAPSFRKTCSVWARSGLAGVRGWWADMPGMSDQTLAGLLSGAAMLSAGVATRIPRLLMPDRRIKCPELDATVRGEGVVAGNPCHVLEVRWINANGTFRETWWVGTNDLLIRQVASTLDLNRAGPLIEKIKADTRERLTRTNVSEERSREILASFESHNVPTMTEQTCTYTVSTDAPIPAAVFEVPTDE